MNASMRTEKHKTVPLPKNSARSSIWHATAGLLPLHRVYIILAGGLVGICALGLPIPPTDFWFHLATGRLIMESGTVPTTDVFSYTQAGAHFFNQSWLAQVALFQLHRWGGIQLVLLAHAASLVIAYGLLLRLCVLRSGGRIRLSVLVLILAVLPVSVTNWAVRPQSLALPLFAAFFVLIEHYRTVPEPGTNQRAPLWPLPLLMILWVNVHGTFVLALALLGIVLCAEALKRALLHQPALTWRAWRRLLGWSGVSVAAILVNPRGFEVLPYVVDLLQAPAVRNLVSEWAPPTVGSATGAMFFAAAVGLFVLASYAPGRPDLTDVLLVVAFFFLGLSAGRHGVWFAMVAAPFAVSQASRLMRPMGKPDPGAPFMNVALATLVLLLLILFLPWIKPHMLQTPAGALVADNTPMAAVEAVGADADRPARLFHGGTYGSYLMWALRDQPVFIDPRIELYPLEQFHDYIALARAEDLDHLLAKYRFDGALLDRQAEAPLVRALAADPEWTLVFQDDHSAYYRRSEG